MENLEILIKLFIAHILGDFLLQPGRWAKKRREEKFRSVHLYLHLGIHGILVYVLLGQWSNVMLPLIIVATHFVIDVGKAYLKERPWLFFADQGLHLLVIFIIWVSFYGDWQALTGSSIQFDTYRVMVVAMAYLLILTPASVVIRIMTEKYQPEISNRKAGFASAAETEKTLGLKDAGKLIGMLERVLILTLILVQQYAVIGFLIASKSVLRYSDIKSNYDRKRVEYILIGTLLSFSFAIITGIFTIWMLTIN
ncbi:MAG: DUF3307 domain-containing protein [Bacteroidales bacterium]